VLPSVPEIIGARRERSRWYDERLSHQCLQRPKAIDGLQYNYAYYPVVFDSHEAMMGTRASLQSAGIFPRRYFYPSLNTLPVFPDRLRKSCPVSESLARRVLALPLFPELTKNDVDVITECIKKSLNS
jgi:dTDP-4-amino-4,6-dideoxygalactose transaminase